MTTGRAGLADLVSCIAPISAKFAIHLWRDWGGNMAAGLRSTFLLRFLMRVGRFQADVIDTRWVGVKRPDMRGPGAIMGHYDNGIE